MILTIVFNLIQHRIKMWKRIDVLDVGTVKQAQSMYKHENAATFFFIFVREGPGNANVLEPFVVLKPNIW